MKRILITGAESYIGTSVEKWLLKDPEQFVVDTIDMRDEGWIKKDFSIYDVVFHVAGIAHVSSDPGTKDLYYKVNTNLAIETAEKAKSDGVDQFIFMSSIIVYGQIKTSQREITLDTEPSPSDFYGDSKLQAEIGIKKLTSKDFKIAILRPPMIYGENSRGNYPKLAKLAKKAPVFPDFENKRSMLYVDNLSEFIKIIIKNESTGIFFPQNEEYVNTSALVKTIANVHENKIRLTRLFNPIIYLLFRLEIIKKVFGSLTYDKKMSEYDFGNYQVAKFIESIEFSEMSGGNGN